MLPVQAHLDDEVMRLVLREIRLLKASVHPNIVHLHEAFKSKSGRVYMVMEHVQHTLTEQLRKNPFGFSPQSVKLITWQLLQATAFLHSNKVRICCQSKHPLLPIRALDSSTLIDYPSGFETSQHPSNGRGCGQALRLWVGGQGGEGVCGLF